MKYLYVLLFFVYFFNLLFSLNNIFIHSLSDTIPFVLFGKYLNKILLTNVHLFFRIECCKYIFHFCCYACSNKAFVLNTKYNSFLNHYLRENIHIQNYPDHIFSIL